MTPSDGTASGPSASAAAATRCSREIDTDGDDVGDSCDNCPNHANADQGDCDDDQIGNACEVFIDCNANGALDECDLVGASYVSASSELSPIGVGSPQSYFLIDPPDADSDVVFSFTASADLASSSERIDVTLNGVAIGSVFELGASLCPADPDTDQLSIPADTYNPLLAFGAVAIAMTARGPVDTGLCPSSYIAVQVEYGLIPSSDCNATGTPDECDVNDGTSLDCQENGVPDECDIDDGTSLDCQSNGLPDECDVDDGTSSDCQPNGVPDECDVTSGASADVNENGMPDECETEHNVGVGVRRVDEKVALRGSDSDGRQFG